MKSYLFSHIDISVLVYFRLIFGAIMMWEVFRYFSHGWIFNYWIFPDFHFKYYGFDWVSPWPGELMYLHFIGLGILSLFILTGFQYRVSTILFFLGFTYVFLLDQANYLNHFYLISWISFLMIFVPANRSFSIDAWRKKELKTETVQGWSLWFLRVLLGIVYFFGGIAKINSDWLQGEPLRMWLANRTDFPLLGQFFREEWMVYSFAYGALLIDLLIVPFLLWKKTRLIAFVIVTTFHLMNSYLFSIGIFPWFMIFATLIFFSPDWPRRLVNKIRNAPHKNVVKAKKKKPNELVKKIIIISFVCFLIIQVTIPLRHHFYPGEVSWTEEGHIFSWHMKLRDKDAYEVEFWVKDPETGEVARFDPKIEITDRQFSKMSTRPDLILQYAHHISDLLYEQGFDEIEVRVNAIVALNAREPQMLIDPNIDLVKQPRTLSHYSWIVQLED